MNFNAVTTKALADATGIWNWNGLLKLEPGQALYPQWTTGHRLLCKGPVAVGKAALFRPGQAPVMQLPATGCQHSWQRGKELPILRESWARTPASTTLSMGTDLSALYYLFKSFLFSEICRV